MSPPISLVSQAKSASRMNFSTDFFAFANRQSIAILAILLSFRPSKKFVRPCRSMDRMPPSEGGDAGSIPAKGI